MNDVLSIADSIQQLQNRGITFTSDELHDAQKFFLTNSYYHFSGYTYIFEDFIQGEARTHRYPNGLTFSEIKSIYLFDKRLRLLIFEALEELEIAIKTIICNDLSLHLGNNFLSQERYFQDGKHRYVINVYKKILRSNSHIPYLEQYNLDNFDRIQSWTLFELMTLGQVLTIYTSLKHPPFHVLIDTLHLPFKIPKNGTRNYKRARNIEIKKDVLSLLQSLKILRNHCAHHNRLVDYKFNSALPPENMSNFSNSNKISRYIYAINGILSAIRPENNWERRIHDLIEQYSKDLKNYYKIIDNSNYHYAYHESGNGLQCIKMMLGYI